MKHIGYIILLIIISFNRSYSQGLNHSWLLGGIVDVLDTNTTSTAARLQFSNSAITIISETRKMAFFETQATISDNNGNLIAASNGCWIMDATGDTMLNGSGLNPGLWASSYCSSTSGNPLSHANVFLPYPDDSSKFVLFHQVGDFNNIASLPSRLYYTIIDKNLNGGLGGVVTNQKNLIAFQDTLSAGIAACKHANGRDWWILAIKDSSNIVYKILLTPNGIDSITTQSLNFPLPFLGNAGQPCFSLDGTKFAYTSGSLNPLFQDVRIFSFDRCTGNLDSIGYVSKNNQAGFGLSFSPNSKYLYYSSFGKVFQLNTDTINIAASDSLVATYDGYAYPFPSSDTNFWLMYLAANGKIYISPSGGVVDYHIINSPDSAGIACDLQQHSLHLPCYSGYGNVYHPNYYLGRLQGSPCDTLQWTGIKEQHYDFHFSVSPNPNNGNFKIMYLLPQNKKGIFEMYDVEGRKVFSYNLPQWSTLQTFNLKNLSEGIYYCMLQSGNERVSKKVVIIK